MPDDGEYLLVVVNGPGESQMDEYDLTIRRTLLDGGVLYTVRTANGPNTTNNKFKDTACDLGDVLISGGVEITSPDVGNDSLAGCVSILENRPLGGASAWRGRASEEYGDCLGGRTNWTLTTWAVCLDATP